MMKWWRERCRKKCDRVGHRVGHRVGYGVLRGYRRSTPEEDPLRDYVAMSSTMEMSLCTRCHRVLCKWYEVRNQGLHSLSLPAPKYEILDDRGEVWMP